MCCCRYPAVERQFHSHLAYFISCCIQIQHACVYLVYLGGERLTEGWKRDNRWTPFKCRYNVRCARLSCEKRFLCLVSGWTPYHQREALMGTEVRVREQGGGCGGWRGLQLRQGWSRGCGCIWRQRWELSKINKSDGLYLSAWSYQWVSL